MKKVLFTIIVLLFVNSCSEDNKTPIKYSISAPNEISLKVGDLVNFKYSITPTNENTHIDSIYIKDTNIAQYSAYGNSKTIKGVGEGETVLIVDAKVEQQKLHKEVKINVLPVGVDSITFDEKSITMEAGSQTTLKVNIFPIAARYKKVNWSSSNENIATVDKGLITAKNVGECNIIASVDNKKVICKLLVKPISVKSIIIQSTTIEIEKYSGSKYLDILIGKEEKLSASILPKKAENKNVKWISTNPEVVKVSEDGLITAIKKGTVRIICESEDNNVRDVLNVSSMDISDFIKISNGMTFGTFDGTYVSAFMYSTIENKSPDDIQILKLTVINNRNYKTYLDETFDSKFLMPMSSLKEGVHIYDEYKPYFTFKWTLQYKGEKFTVSEVSSPEFR